MRHTLILVVAIVVSAPPLTAQFLEPARFAADTRGTVQQTRPRKSPTLAAVLSWFVWPGVGSYYAGNSAHGTRHVLIGVAAIGGAIPLLVTCDNDGFCDFDNDTVRLTAVGVLAAAFVGNAVWSVITAIGDAEAHNMQTASAGPALARAVVVALPSGGPAGWRLGIQVMTVRF